MTLSGGVASFPEDGGSLEDLVRRADESLYRAKALGKDCIALHHAERRREVRYPARASARIEVGAVHGSEWLPALVMNLSRSGALVSTRTPLGLAEAVRVALISGGRGDDGRRWLVEGRVVRVQPRTTYGHPIGIAFDRPLPESCLRSHTRTEGTPRSAVGGGAL